MTKIATPQRVMGCDLAIVAVAAVAVFCVIYFLGF
jgi:hypothetical protein